MGGWSLRTVGLYTLTNYNKGLALGNESFSATQLTRNKMQKKILEYNRLGQSFKFFFFENSSGPPSYENKTELCIFHQKETMEGQLQIASKEDTNILGMTFDSKLKWGPKVS
jgi:hypothetical protein